MDNCKYLNYIFSVVADALFAVYHINTIYTIHMDNCKCLNIFSVVDYALFAGPPSQIELRSSGGAGEYWGDFILWASIIIFYYIFAILLRIIIHIKYNRGAGEYWGDFLGLYKLMTGPGQRPYYHQRHDGDPGNFHRMGFSHYTLSRWDINFTKH